ncbi:MAG TPA: DUF6526 family protein [Flavisolibacter sp.]|nr:DUF6526 family protein [Flavisolibacter sp.]
MPHQSAAKHSRLVPGFHFLTFFIILAAIIIAIILMNHRGISHETVFYLLTAVAMGLLFAYLRVFSVRNQDRIIRAEENFRSYRLTGKELDSRLHKSQVIALRFADDEEFPGLCQRAADENLTAAQIKGAIQKWRADHHRV